MVKSPPASAGDPCSCLAKSADSGAWRAAVHGAAESRTRLTAKPPPPARILQLKFAKTVGLNCSPYRRREKRAMSWVCEVT